MDTISLGACAVQTLAQFALDQINSQSELLPNVTLGIVSVDTCATTSSTMDASLYFMPDEESSLEKNSSCYGSGFDCFFDNGGSEYLQSYSVVGVLGTIISDFAVAVSPLLGIYHIPLIGILATSDELSDKDQFPYFARLVAPDRFAAQAILDIASHYNWTYVSLVYSEDDYGLNGAEQIERLLLRSQYNICLAVSIKIPFDATIEEFHSFAVMLRNYPKARAVVNFINHAQRLQLFAAM